MTMTRTGTARTRRGRSLATVRSRAVRYGVRHGVRSSMRGSAAARTATSTRRPAWRTSSVRTSRPIPPTFTPRAGAATGPAPTRTSVATLTSTSGRILISCRSSPRATKVVTAPVRSGRRHRRRTCWPSARRRASVAATTAAGATGIRRRRPCSRAAVRAKTGASSPMSRLRAWAFSRRVRTASTTATAIITISTPTTRARRWPARSRPARSRLFANGCCGGTSFPTRRRSVRRPH